MSLQAELIELGWVALIRRVTGLRPAEAHALRHLVRNAGRTVSLARLADAYEQARLSGAVVSPNGRISGSDDAIRKRIERARAAVAELDCAGAIRTVRDAGYMIEPHAASRIEAALVRFAGYGEDIAA